MYQNVRGLKTKLTTLFVDSFEFNHHVIIFTETWLNVQIHNSEILCDEYHIYRCDRTDITKKTGGGVLIAVSTKFPSEQIIDSFTTDIEFVAVKIKLRNKSLFIACSYIPPGSNADIYIKHMSAMKKAFSNTKTSDLVIFIGDFNLSSITWTKSYKSNNLVPVVINGCVNEFIELLFGYGLSQVNHIQNAYGKLLDLIFINDPSEVLLQSSIPITFPEDRYHPTLSLKILLPFNPPSPKLHPNKKIYCFSKTDYLKLNGLLSATQWNDILSSSDFDEMVKNFYNTLNACISETVPMIFTRKKIGPPWNNSSLAKFKNKKNKMYKKFKKSGSIIDFSKYSIARSVYNIENKNAYINHLTRIKYDLKRNPKSFYNFVNSKRRSRGYPNSLKFGPFSADDDSSISNIFADFFATTYSIKNYNHSVPYPFDITKASSIINVSSINNITVFNNLKTLKNTYNPGPDGIPNNILKNCADSLSYPLTILFNHSLRTGYLPSLWKESYIIPLYKSGNKNSVSNYRGIAKLSAIPKLLEKIITDSLSHQVSSILSPHQHGFRKFCSTITNVLELTTNINEGFRDRMQTDVIYTDFSKAFDKVNHELLLYKLNSMGFSNSLVIWLKCYLTKRSQRVKFKNAISKNIEVFSGVPQGSHLGPVLFTLFINDLPSVIQHSKVLMYADDVKIFLSLQNNIQHFLLQSDINNFCKWCNVNLMELNIKKCKHMAFYRRNNLHSTYFVHDAELDSVEFFLDLGILLDHRLNFRPHISMAINKAYGVLGFMKRWSKEFSDPYVTKQLYTSLVRPVLEYGSIIWDPCYTIHINLVESVQKQFLLFCLRGLRWNYRTLPSYKSRLALIKLPTLKSRRTMLSISFLLSLLRGDIDSNFLLSRIQINIPSRPTRNYKFLNINYSRFNYANNDPFRRLCDQFNGVYHIIDLSENKESLKRKIILYLNN